MKEKSKNSVSLSSVKEEKKPRFQKKLLNYLRGAEEIELPNIPSYPYFLDSMTNPSSSSFFKVESKKMKDALTGNATQEQVTKLKELLGQNSFKPAQKFLSESYSRYWLWVRTACKLYMQVIKIKIFIEKTKLLLKSLDTLDDAQIMAYCRQLNRQNTQQFHSASLQAFSTLQQNIRDHSASNDSSWLARLLLQSMNTAIALYSNDDTEGNRTDYLSYPMIEQYFCKLIEERIDQEHQRLEYNKNYGVITDLAGSFDEIYFLYQTQQHELKSYFRKQEEVNQAFEAVYSHRRVFDHDTEKNLFTLVYEGLKRYKGARDSNTKNRWKEWLKCLIEYGYSPFKLLEVENVLDIKAQSIAAQEIKDLLMYLDWELLSHCLDHLITRTELSEKLRLHLRDVCRNSIKYSKNNFVHWFALYWVALRIKLKNLPSQFDLDSTPCKRIIQLLSSILCHNTVPLAQLDNKIYEEMNEIDKGFPKFLLHCDLKSSFKLLDSKIKNYEIFINHENLPLVPIKNLALTERTATNAKEEERQGLLTAATKNYGAFDLQGKEIEMQILQSKGTFYQNHALLSAEGTGCVYHLTDQTSFRYGEKK